MSKFLPIAVEAAKYIKEELKNYFGREMGTLQHRDGGLFISCIADGKMASAFWHPERKHSATCCHGKKIIQKAVSDPGYWAIAYAGCSIFGGNKCYYNDNA